MACSLSWIPDTLYNLSVSVVASNYAAYEKRLSTFNGYVLFDIFYKIYKEGNLIQLGNELAKLDEVEKVLKAGEYRSKLHNCFQALMDHGFVSNKKLAEEFKKSCYSVKHASFSKKQKLIELGLKLELFLNDAGWFSECESILRDCIRLLEKDDNSSSADYSSSSDSDTSNSSSDHNNSATDALYLKLEVQKRLLRAQNLFFKFKEALNTITDTQNLIAHMKSKGLTPSLASFSSEVSHYYYTKSDYKQAFTWSWKSFMQLSSSPVSHRELIELLCIGSKAFIVQRHLKMAELLIKQAVIRAREHFGSRHLIYANALMAYGNYLMHADYHEHCVKVFQNALDIRTSVLGGVNLLVAETCEDLAYATYVFEYISGHFRDAREHVQKALSIKQALLPERHFLIASAKRILALIVEEIALDSSTQDEHMFLEAEELQMSAIQITLEYLGENNVLSGKHYGNLGRLYQSMRKFQEAQRMHLKAVEIKQSILGMDHYEVALSMGHLASLYNYDMKMYDLAEDLYLKSIKIGVDQFGKGYSGLEFDYRGLIGIYLHKGDAQKVAEVYSALTDWQELRSQMTHLESSTSPLDIQVDLILPEELYQSLRHLSRLSP